MELYYFALVMTRTTITHFCLFCH